MIIKVDLTKGGWCGLLVSPMIMYEKITKGTEHEKKQRGSAIMLEHFRSTFVCSTQMSALL